MLNVFLLAQEKLEEALASFSEEKIKVNYLDTLMMDMELDLCEYQ